MSYVYPLVSLHEASRTGKGVIYEYDMQNTKYSLEAGSNNENPAALRERRGESLGEAEIDVVLDAVVAECRDERFYVSILPDHRGRQNDRVTAD